MQLLRIVILVAPVAVSLAAGAADARHPRKRPVSGRPALRVGRSQASRYAARNDDYWAIRDGLLHLEAAEVETEAVQDITRLQREDEAEEHPEMAQAEAQEERQVEGRAVADWSAVAQAASAEAMQLRQQANVGTDSYAAPAAAPNAAAAADFSWAHKMDAGRALQEQGFEGKAIRHVDYDTMTEDWHKEHVQSWSTLNEICAACARHPDNSWCRGKCPGTLARLGGRADEALAHAATATSDAAADASAAARRGGGSLQDRMPDTFPEAKLPGSDRMPDSFPEAELPGSDGKGSRGPPGGLGDVFRSKASGRALGLPLLLVAALLGLQ